MPHRDRNAPFLTRFEPPSWMGPMPHLPYNSAQAYHPEKCEQIHYVVEDEHQNLFLDGYRFIAAGCSETD
jgi:hypothetical protein